MGSYKKYGFTKLSTGSYLDDSGTVWSSRAVKSAVAQARAKEEAKMRRKTPSYGAWGVRPQQRRSSPFGMWW